jgi:hypothetical protein
MSDYTYSVFEDASALLSRPMVLRSDGMWIPMDSHNLDYKRYIDWVLEGNEPDAYDPFSNDIEVVE